MVDNTRLNINNNGTFTILSGGFTNPNGYLGSGIHFQNSGSYSLVVEDVAAGLNIGEIYIGDGTTLSISGGGTITTLDDLEFRGDNGNVQNNLTGSFTVNDNLDFYGVDGTHQNCTFTNNQTITFYDGFLFDGGSHTVTNSGTITLVDIFAAAGSNSNSITNSGNFNFDYLDISNSDLVINNSGIVNMTGGFHNCGGSEAINNLNGGQWFWAGVTYHAGLDLYCNNDANYFFYSRASNQDIIVPVVAYWHLGLGGSGTKEAQGDLEINGDLGIDAGIEFDVATNNADINLAGSWGNVGGFFTEGNQSVILDGSDLQDIFNSSGETFYDLQINNSSNGISLNNGNVTISNILNMNQGNVTTGAYEMILGTGTGIIGSLTHNSGTIIGDFRRWVNTLSLTDYEFPVGTIGNHRPANIHFNDAVSGSLVGTFLEDAPGELGLSLDDNGVCVVHTYNIGYWSLSAENGLSSSDYNLSLDADGFTSPVITPVFRLLTRATSGSNWIADGTHVPAVMNSVKRSNINTLPAEYTVGDPTDDEDPTITCPGNLAAECDINVPPPYADYAAFLSEGGSASDNCGGINASSFTHVGDVSDGLSCPETVTRTYRISDNVGNSATCQQSIVIEPATSPSEFGGPVSTDGGTVECLADAVAPGTLPVVEDVCGNVLAPPAPTNGGTYDGCEGTYTWEYTYTDCADNSFDWTHTYTVDYSGGLTAPASTVSTVSCPAAAVDPGAPADITDACGRTVSAVLVGSTETPNPVTCEGSVEWRYRYTACDGVTTADWTHTYTVDYSGGLTAPGSTVSTVSCPAAAVDPGAPADITDACGRTVSAVLVGSTEIPDPVTCEGSVEWRYRYTACDGVTTADWTHTYTVDYSGGLTAPGSTVSTVSCPAAAVDPGAPADITDACGRTVSAVLVGSTETPNPVTCEGSVEWRYRYTACDGVTTADWTHTYTVDYSGGLTAPGSTVSTVSCPAAAVDPGAPADITDACGRTVSAVLVGSTEIPDPVTCEGSVEWRYRYTACDGVTTVDWTHTYTVDYSGGLTAPGSTVSTVSCPAAAVDPGAPADITDACGRTVSAVLVGSTETPNPVTCEGSVEWRYRYTACDGVTTADWTHTYTVDYSGGLTAPGSTVSTVSCPAAAVDPGAPADITDACGRTVSAVLVGSTEIPDPVTCEGSVEWRYRYTACDGVTTADWTHTYTVDYSGGLTAPGSTVSTVSCPAAAVDPGAPADITDACGRTVSAVLVGSTEIPDPVTCEGSVEWRYRYTACDGVTTADWTHTYTVDYSGGLTAPGSTVSTVSCPAAAVDPGAPADITDACGRTVSAVLVGSTEIPDPVTCEGSVEWRYRYTACDGVTTADWTHTYTVDYSGGLTAPGSTVSTVSCSAAAVDPGAPADITDACGRTVSAVLVGSTEIPDPVTCEGSVEWRYRYTACDGVTTADWTHTYTVDYSGGLTAPGSTVSTVSCPAAAVDPGAPADITDACGRTVSAVLVGSTEIPDPVTCEGSVEWRYRYTACDGVTTADWTHTYTVDYSGGLTAPGSTVSTVSCPAAAVDPGAPADITDACGRTVSAVLVGSTETPNPVTCEGSVEWRYRYTACDGVTTADWTHTYTVDYSGGLTAPGSTVSTVSCPAAAVDPGAPADITDACGRTVSAVLVGSTETPNPVTCEGSVEWRYRYTACDGVTTADWTHTYTVDYSGGLTAPGSTVSTVSCPAAAVDPGAPADITDACGRTVSAVLVGSTEIPDPVTCEGSVEWRYRYTACDGVTTADWTHTYTVDYSGGLTAPGSTVSTVSCSAAAVDPGAPADITDACGRTVSAVLVGSTEIPDPVTCEGSVEWRYRYTACDGVTTADWTHTYTVDYSGGLTAPGSTVSTVSCPAAAVDPGAPADITDACGRTVSAVLVGSTEIPDPVTCEGSVEWRYRYTACDGVTTADWTHTYTVDRTTPPSEVGGPVSTDGGTVECFPDAVAPTILPVVHDVCGNLLTPSAPTNGGTYDGCEGTYTWIYTYMDCSGLTYDWTYSYYINDTTPPILIPKQNIAVALSEINGIYVLKVSDIDSISYDQCGSIDTMYLDRDTLTCVDLGLTPIKFYAIDGCGNIDSTVVNVTVYYETSIDPQVTYDSIICNEAILEIELDNPFDNMKFVWTVSNNPFITGGYTSPDSVDAGPYPFIIQDTLYNSSNTVQSVVYTIIPYPWSSSVYDDQLCPIDFDTTYTVYVNPSPRINVVVDNDTICDEGTSTITVSSPVGLTTGSVLFDYTIDGTSGVAGDVTGQDSNTGVSLGSFTQTLDNHTDLVQWVEYRIHPYARGTGSVIDCDYGTSLDSVFRIYVNPSPRINVVVDNDTICDEGTSTITVSSPVGLTTGSVLFDYTIDGTSGVAGDVTGQDSNTGVSLGSFTQTLNNHTDLVQWVEYRIHPYARGTGSGIDCDYGTSLDSVFRIYVNPSPRINVVVDNDTICDEGTSTITVSSPVGLTTGSVLFDYTIDGTSGVAGDVTGQDSNTGVSLGSFTQTLDNHTDLVQWVEYRIHPYARGTGSGIDCDYGTSLDSVFRIYVNPSPRINVVVDNDTICDEGTSTITVSSPVGLTTGSVLFDYTIDGTSGVAGDVTGQDSNTGVSLGSFTQTLDNHTDLVQWVEYRIHPYARGTGSGIDCDYGTSLDSVFRIYVNPSPRINVVVDNDTICDEGTSTITVSSPVGLTTGSVLFDYTIDGVSGVAGDVTGQDSNTGVSLGSFTQTLDNHTDLVQWVEYRIHPYARGTGSGIDCDYGTSLDSVFRIYVNPSPRINVVVDNDTICDEGTSTITVSSPVGLTTGSVLFDYTIDGTSGVAGDVTGQDSNTGVSLGSFTQTLDNHTDLVQWVEYRIHPYARGTGSGIDCDYGTSLDSVFRIYVNPSPRINVVVDNDTICDEGTSTITVSSPVGLTTGSVLFDYTIDGTSGVAGDVTGQDSNTGVSLGSFTQTLDNHTDLVQWVEYRIHPYARGTGSGIDCDYGTSLDSVFRIYVNPSPRINVVVDNDTICDEGTSTITVSSPVGLTTGSVLFDYTIDGVSGVAGDVTGQDSNTGVSLGSFTQTLDNHTDLVQWVEYRIHPYARGTGSGIDCDYGTSLDSVFRIYVNPSPRINVVVDNDTICDEGTSTITVSSPVGLTTGSVLFDYTIDGVSGVAGDVTGQDSNTGVSLGSFTQTLDNHTDLVQWVEYRIHPYARGTGSGIDCDYGTSLDSVFRIYVNPSPRINVVVDNDTICDEGTSTITVSSPVGLTTGSVLFDYTIDGVSGVAGDVTGQDSNTGVSLGSFTQTLDNHTDLVQWVEYRIHPYARGTGSGIDCDYGTSLDSVFRIYVNPSPRINVVVDNDTICDEGTSTITVSSPVGLTTGSVLFDYTIDGTSGVAGDVTGQDSNTGVSLGSFTQTLDNHTDLVQWVEYRIHPYARGTGSGIDCDYGTSLDSVFRIYVNPSPRINVVVDNDTICDEGTSTITVSSPVGLTTGSVLFDYTIDGVSGVAGDVTGQDSNTGVSLGSFTQTLDNHTDLVQWVEYRIHPYARGTGSGIDCDYGTSLDSVFRIYVNPSPRINVVVDNDTICDEGTSTITVSSPVGLTTGSVLFDYTIDGVSGVAGDVTGQDSNTGVSLGSFTQTLDNHTDLVQWVEYRIHPYARGTGSGIDCDYGTSLDSVFRIYVNPSPRINVVVDNDTICDEGTSTITVSSPVGLTTGSVLFDYTIDGVSGVAGDVTGQDSNTGVSLGSFTQTLDNHTDLVQWVEYRIHPYARGTGSGIDCDYGTSLDSVFRIYVNPSPRINVVVDNDTICDEGTSTITVSSPVGLTTGSVLFDYTIDGVSGVAGDVTGQDSNTGVSLGSFTQTLDNHTDLVQWVEYRIHPYARGTGSGIDCDYGTSLDSVFRIYVNPSPRINVVVDNDTICDEGTSTITVSSPVGLTTGSVLFDYTIDGVSGVAGDVTGQDSNTGVSLGSFTQTLDNHTDLVQWVEYRIHPYARGTGSGIDCDYGTSLDSVFRIYVNPSPRINVVVDNDTICDEGTSTITVSSPVGLTTGSVLFDYTIDGVSGVAGDVTGQDSNTGVSLGSFTQTLDNHTDLVQWVEYRIHPYARGTGSGIDCDYGTSLDSVFRIYVNPSPRINVVVDNDTICDEGTSTITVSSPVGLTTGSVLFDYTIDGTSGVAGDVTGQDSNTGVSLGSFTQTLDNHTDLVQWVEYRIHPYARGTGSGIDCDYGTSLDSVFRIYLNPTPRLRYLLSADTLCHSGGFELVTDSITRTTQPHYYDLNVISNPDLTGVIGSPVSRPVVAPLDQWDLYNPGDSVATVTYLIHPYIWGEGCPGEDTVITIKVNPEPKVLIQESLIPWAVCHDSGYVIPMSSSVFNTTGDLRYNLYTDGYNVGNVNNVQGDGDYIIAPMDQTTVLNHGDSIENVTYHILPVIRNTGPAGFCEGSPLDSIMVQVAPELRGNLEPDTSYIGGHQVRCYGLEDVLLHSNVRGGYYRNPYDFNWDTDGGTVSNLVPEDSVQDGMGEGKYWYDVVDIIGCFFTDTITLTQPDTIEVPAVIVDATCAATNMDDGSIVITPVGGIEGYSYDWTGPFGYTNDEQNVLDANAGPYRLVLNDTNRCEYSAIYWIDAAEGIFINASSTPYGNYEITCNGASTGKIIVNSIVGGFNDPSYTLLAIDENTGDTVYNQSVLESDGTYSAVIGNLPAGEYRLWAYDQVNCYNLNQANTTYPLDEPDTISIIRHDAQPYHDTVDISCFGADDGFIDIEVSGGHTVDYQNTFLWTGPPGETDLVPGDSIQGSAVNGILSGGTYDLHITDKFGCEQWAEFTLYEPTQIVLDVDSIRELNGWNITCFGDNDGFIELNSSGGIMEHNYEWSAGMVTLPDPFQQDIYDLEADTFHLTITDSIGCTLDTVFELIQPNLLGMDTIIPRINEWEIACAGDSTGEITLIPLGGADSLNNTYLWSTDTGNLGDETSMNQTGLSEGNYTVLVTDINGCTFMEAYELLDPDPIVIDTLFADSAYCHGTASGEIHLNAYGGVDPFEYLWSNGDITEDIDGLYAGVYIIVITDDNGCILIDSTEVFEADHFDVALTVASDYNGTVISCTGFSDGVITSETLGGTPPYIFEWNTGETTQNLTGVPAGSYRVKIVDIHGCVDSAEVSLDDPLPIDYSMQLQDPLCYNDSTGQIELLITGGTVHSVDDYEVWVNEIVTGTFAGNLPEGVYHIRIEDLNDCFVETDAELINPDSLELSFDTENAFCKDKPDGEMQLYIDGGFSPYDISWNMGLPDNEDNFNELYSGVYVATVTDAHLCITTDTVYVDYTYISCLEIPNAFSPNGDGFNDLWMIEGLELYPNAEIRIFDRWGNRIYYSPNAADDPWDGTFDGRRLPIDSYHYIIYVNSDEPAITGNITIVR